MSLLQQISDALGDADAGVAVPPPSSDVELKQQLEESVMAWDYRTLQAYVLEQRLVEQEQFWDLINLLAPTLTIENLRERPRWFTTARRCITFFARHGKSKEMVLALLEQLEGFHDDALFVSILPCLQDALLRLPVKRGRSLELTLDTLGCHIATLPPPANWDLEGKEIKLLETDESVRRFLDVVPAFVDFMQPFLQSDCGGGEGGENEGRCWERRVLKKHLMRLLQHPLVFLDLRHNIKETAPKTYSREVAESVITALCWVEKNFYRLIVQDPAEGRAVVTDRQDIKTSHAEPSDVEEVDLEDQNAENELKEKSGVTCENEEETIADEFSELSAACLAYLVEVEWLGQERWPAVISSLQLMHVNLSFVRVLVTNAAHTAVFKGISLLSFSLGLLNDWTLTLDDLDDANFNPVINALIKVMRYCPVWELRTSALSVFKTMFSKLGSPARHLLMKSLLSSCEHAGVKGVVVGLIKDDVTRALDLLNRSQTYGTDVKAVKKSCDEETLLPEYFLHDRLRDLLTLAIKLSEGAATDLLEESDLIMATLNLLRYLVLRDPRDHNQTGFWDMTAWLEKEYLSALRTGLDMSVGHYQLELNNMTSGAQSQPVAKDDEVVASVTVAGMKLPSMSRQQQLNVMHSALVTFDLMKCVLGRLSELMDQKVKAL